MPIHEQKRIPAGLTKRLVQLADILNGLTIHFLDNVSTAQSRICFRSRRAEVGDNNSLGGRREAQLVGRLGIEVLERHSL